MSRIDRHWWTVAAFAVLAVGTGLLPGVAGRLQIQSPLEFCGLMLVVVATSAFRRAHSIAAEGAVMPVSFVFDFAALLLLGPNVAMLVATAGTLTERLAHPQRAHRVRRLIVNGAAGIIGIQLAGLTHDQLGGTLRHFSWPWQALPIAAAVIVYCVARSASVHALAPLVMRQPIDRSWPKRAFDACPTYLIGASLAVALVEVIDHRAWELLVVAAAPVYFGYRAYCDYVRRLEDDHHSRQVHESLDEGMSVLDSNGRVTVWSHGLEHILGCRRERAIGMSLVGAVPALGATELPRAIDSTFTSQGPQTLLLGMAAGTQARMLQVKIIPSSAGVTLLWYDATARTQTERELKRKEERLALAAEGANDGLWEWDLRTDEIYLSTRWRSLLGLPPAGDSDRPESWFELVHPDDIASLKEALRAHLTGETEHLEHEHRIRHVDGDYRRVLCRGVAARGAGRRPARIAGSLTETVERAPIESRRPSDAGADPLTGLGNRTMFVEGLGRRLNEYKQQVGGDRFAVLYLDLDRFKVVNDSLGHFVGDELLVEVSRRLESCLRPKDAIARLGGDEFAILLDGLGDEQQANAVAFRIQESLATPFLIDGREVFTSVSIGIASGLRKYTNPDDIMRDADTAMYHAKRRGKARHEVFDADMNARVQDRLSLENDLRRAVSSNDFEVQYQPIVLLGTGMCIGFESLVRWTRNGEAVSPGKFVPIAEELGLIEPLGTWVLQHACQAFADWKRRFPDRGLECITVNASSRQLMQQNFVNVVQEAVTDAGLEPSEVRIEITETALMDSPGEAAEVLRQLRDFGVKIYLDDFGTGYSSLSHLHKLPVDALKIDRSFVKSLTMPDRPAIVESILALARTLNTSVVAEGIESDAQARELTRLGCTHAQGYFFSRPLSSSAVEALLVANEPLGPKAVAAEHDAEIYYPSGPFTWRATAGVRG